MKKYILTLSIMASLSLNSLAETNNVDNYKAISKNIMSSYNINDAKKFANDFNAKLSNNLSENQIKAVIEGLQSQFGQIQNLSEPKFISENTYSFLVDLENGKINLVLKFDPQNKLAGILFKPLDSLVYPKINKDTSINDIIKPYMDEKSNVGLAVGIIDNNDQKNLVYGKNDKDKKTLIDNQTIFEIGSISKVFTNIVLADMSLNKELNLNDPIVKYLPKSKKALEFKNRKINFVDLATHTSGLPRLPEDLDKTIKIESQPYAEYTKDNLYNYVLKYKLKREIGKTYEYSNLGTGLIGEALADIEKTSYEDLIKNHITSKLKMNSTGIHFNKSQMIHFSTGHDKGQSVPMWDFKSMQGAGAIKSDLNDMMKFLSANMSLIEDNPLQKAMDLSHQLQFQDTNFGIGLGWHITKIKTGDKVIWHNGATAGFTSFIGFIKDKKVGVVILSNSSNSVDEPAVLILEKLAYQSKK